MTALIMPSDFGMEMLIGSSPILTPGFLAAGSPAYFTDLSGRYAPMVWGGYSSHVSCSTESAAVTTITAKTLMGTSTICGFNDSSDTTPSLFGTNSAVNGINGGDRTPPCGLRRTGSKRDSTRESGRRRKLGVTERPASFNLKSCLASRNEEPICEGATSPSKEKKKVSFADMLGQDLARIKIITERPDCPPRWSPDFLEQVTGGAKPEALPAQWEIAFAQPASDYLKWKKKLEEGNVALENVVVNAKENELVGSIKVRNIAFHKKVTIRYTSTDWASVDDVEATYLQSASGCGTYNIYDTFSFKIQLPPFSTTDKVEFCICYETEGDQFWDNNSNKNYAVVSFRTKSNEEKKSSKKPKEVFDVHLEAWSEFSAWNHLNTEESRYY